MIATPIVLNIIKEVKKSSTEASMKMIEHAAEVYYYNNSISEKSEEITFICNKGKCSSEDKVLKLKGNTPELGIIKIDKNGKVTLKSILMNGYSCSKKNSSYKCEKVNKKRIETDENLIHINDNKLIHVTDYRIYGNSEQNGNPTSTDPVEIQNVGDLVTDTTSEHYGKYEIKIKVVGKNILDKNKSVENAIKSETSFSSWATSVFDNNWVVNNLKSNTKYTISYDVECTSIPEYDTKHVDNLGLYITNGTNSISLLISEYLNVGDKRHILIPFTTPNNISDNKLNYRILAYTNRYLKDNVGVLGSMIFSNIQLEIGDTSTEYEPYKEEIYSIYLDEPLRCVKDTCDYIDFSEKKIVRKIRKYVFTGKESWGGGDIGKSDWGGTNTVGFYQYINTNGGNIFGKYYPSEKGLSINNYFINLNNGLYNQDVEGEKTMKNTYYSMRINRSVLEEYGSDNSSVSLNKTAFASFLKDKYEKGNPVYALYELEKEIEEEISLPEIYLNEDISNIIIDTKIKPSKIELEYYK